MIATLAPAFTQSGDRGTADVTYVGDLLAMLNDSITNTEIMLWAIYELGGAERFVDVEDASWKAFVLAPQRFAWRTRSDLPDRLKTNSALHTADAMSPRYLLKNGSDQRRLTLEGQQWIEENFDRLAEALSGNPGTAQPPSRRTERQVKEVLRSAIFSEWKQSGVLPPEKWRFADLFHCSPDSPSSVWRQRIDTLRSAAYGVSEDDVLKFLSQIITEHPDWI